MNSPEDSRSNKLLLISFAASFLCHLILSALIASLPPAPEKKATTVGIDIIEKPSTSSFKNRAEHLLNPKWIPHPNKEDVTPPDRAKFLSEKKQRVTEELKARHSGLTMNRPDREESKPLPPTLRDGLFKNENRGFSTLTEKLPDYIRVGSITSVDTDADLFYSYFARAKELLWHQWHPLIRSILFNPPPKLKASDQSQFVSLFDVWFYPTGQLHSLHLLKPSGIPEFDHAAATAFNRVGLIPNPPREKIDSDGLIRFRWAFTVEVQL